MRNYSLGASTSSGRADGGHTSVKEEAKLNSLSIFSRRRKLDHMRLDRSLLCARYTRCQFFDQLRIRIAIFEAPVRAFLSSLASCKRERIYFEIRPARWGRRSLQFFAAELLQLLQPAALQVHFCRYLYPRVSLSVPRGQSTNSANSRETALAISYVCARGT